MTVSPTARPVPLGCIRDPEGGVEFSNRGPCSRAAMKWPSSIASQPFLLFSPAHSPCLHGFRGVRGSGSGSVSARTLRGVRGSVAHPDTVPGTRPWWWPNPPGPVAGKPWSQALVAGAGATPPRYPRKEASRPSTSALTAVLPALSAVLSVCRYFPLALVGVSIGTKESAPVG